MPLLYDGRWLHKLCCNGGIQIRTVMPLSKKMWNWTDTYDMDIPRREDALLCRWQPPKQVLGVQRRKALLSELPAALGGVDLLTSKLLELLYGSSNRT